MLPACTAYADNQLALSLFHILGNQERKQFAFHFEEFKRLRIFVKEILHFLIVSRKFPQLRIIKRVGQEPDIQYQVTVQGQSVFKSEGLDYNQHFRR